MTKPKKTTKTNQSLKASQLRNIHGGGFAASTSASSAPMTTSGYTSRDY